jgi:hypothetical protein
LEIEVDSLQPRPDLARTRVREGADRSGGEGSELAFNRPRRHDRWAALFEERESELLETHNVPGLSEPLRDIVGRTVVPSGASSSVPSVRRCNLLKSPNMGESTVCANLNNALGQAATCLKQGTGCSDQST